MFLYNQATTYEFEGYFHKAYISTSFQKSSRKRMSLKDNLTFLTLTLLLYIHFHNIKNNNINAYELKQYVLDSQTCNVFAYYNWKYNLSVSYFRAISNQHALNIPPKMTSLNNIQHYYPYRAFGGQNKIVYSTRFVTRRAIILLLPGQ